MSDLISRQAVLDCIEKSVSEYRSRYTADMMNMWGLFTQMIKEIPSAETHDKHTETHGVCSDLIRRFDAIEAVASADETDGTVKVFTGRQVNGILSALPSAEAVQGEWIDIDNYYRMATCSHCHKVTMFEKWGEYTQPYDFCPNCGAKMKGGDDE